jgi:beta-galactosidase/beta-glucuronidase
MLNFNKLYSNEYEKMDKNCPLSEYPFENFKRDSYKSLNGIWNYKTTKNPNDLSNIEDKILVPFPIESNASLVGKKLNKGEYIVYKTNFKLDNSFIKKNTFLHFLGVDQTYHIILNGIKYNEVIPLNMPTKIDVSSSIKEDNELIVVVKDNLEAIYPLGKQSKKPKGIFYTPFSGIYYPVFVESVDDDYIENIKISTTLTSVKLHVDTKATNINIVIKDKDNIIINEMIDTNTKEFFIPKPILWTPDNPHLYNLEIKTSSDSITSYFGLRTIELKDGFVYLNNEKIFLNGVLDQGYYPEGIITPVTYKQLENDIITMKELGFNTLRKHIKVEIPYFYYLCDKHGMLVLQDFVNNGKYNFFFLTALPTIGMQKFNDKVLNTNKIQRENFITGGKNLIEYLSNHPSIVGYTIFNEGWGQFDSNSVYEEFKNLYPNLIFDATSGWFRNSKTDMESYHWYFKNLDKLKTVENPVFISEFGALCYKYKDHCYGNRNVFGYTYFDTLEILEDEFIKLYEEKIIPYKDKLIGTIFTQLSDVEEEDNGLLTYDRKIIKINKDKVKEVLNKLK